MSAPSSKDDEGCVIEFKNLFKFISEYTYLMKGKIVDHKMIIHQFPLSYK